jgi:hypothetical protein
VETRATDVAAHLAFFLFHWAFIHVDIKDGKVWIQHNMTDQPIAEELVALGIPQDQIVLGFHPPYVRPHTGFAVN